MLLSSTLLCIILAVNPATVLSAPAPKAATNLIQRGRPYREESSHSESDAGAGWDFRVPGGPAANFGGHFHHEHSEQSQQSGRLTRKDTPSNEQSSHSESDAGSGWDFSVPGGPSASFGGSFHHEHSDQSQQSGGYPSQGNNGQSSNYESDIGSDWDFSVPGGPSASFGGHYHHEHSEQSQSGPAPVEPSTTPIVVPPEEPAPAPPSSAPPTSEPSTPAPPAPAPPVQAPPAQPTGAAPISATNPQPEPNHGHHTPEEGCPAPYEAEPGVVVVCDCEE